MIRPVRPGVVAFAVASSLALPAAVQAAPTLYSTPVKVGKGYSLSLSGTKDDVKATLFRRGNGSTQSYLVEVGSKVKFTSTKDLRSATLSASLAPYGRLVVRFRAKSALKRVPLPRGCRGKSGRGRSGVITGTIKVKPGSKTFSIRRTRGSLANGLFITASCATGLGDTGGGHGVALDVADASGSSLLRPDFQFTRINGRVTEYANYTGFSAHGDGVLLATARARAGGSAFTNASDFSSASVTGAGPFFAGTLQYMASDPHNVTGSFVAKFDLLGRKPLRLPAYGTFRQF